MPSPCVPGGPLRLPAIVIAVLAAGLVAGCSASGATAGTTSSPPVSTVESVAVVASFYPVQWLAGRVGGECVDVTSLTPPGTEPHDLSVDASGQRALAEADAVFYLGSDFQPDVEKAVIGIDRTPARVDLLTVPGVRLLAAPADLGKESLAGGKDPHVWLDPTLMSAMAAPIAQTLTQVAPACADSIAGNLAAVQRDLAALDGTLRGELTGCVTETVVTSHAAFGYLTERYGLRQLAIAGVSPEDEPSAQTLREIADAARRAGVSTVFFEDALPADLSRTVAKEIGAEVDLLSALEFDPAVTIGPQEDYLSVMADNGERLHRGLRCA